MSCLLTKADNRTQNEPSVSERVQIICSTWPCVYHFCCFQFSVEPKKPKLNKPLPDSSSDRIQVIGRISESPTIRITPLQSVRSALCLRKARPRTLNVGKQFAFLAMSSITAIVRATCTLGSTSGRLRICDKVDVGSRSEREFASGSLLLDKRKTST